MTGLTHRSAAILTVSTIALGIYSARVSTGVAGRYIEARLGKPSLIRETSRETGLRSLTGPVKRVVSRMMGAPDPSKTDVLDGVILEPTVSARLRSVAEATRHTKRNKAPFRHLLLYGPPGWMTDLLKTIDGSVTLLLRQERARHSLPRPLLATAGWSMLS